MPNEELVQRGYLRGDALRGTTYGDFESLNLGSTTVAELRASGLHALVPETVDFPFEHYEPPSAPSRAKPDQVFARRDGEGLHAVAVCEHKAPSRRSEREIMKAIEQALHPGLALGVRVAVTTDGSRYTYIDVESSGLKRELVFFDEDRNLTPAVLTNLLAGDAAGPQAARRVGMAEA